MHSRNRRARLACAVWGLVALAVSFQGSEGKAQESGASAAASPPSAGTWRKVADEWTTFTVSDRQRVRYGSGATWIEATVSGAVPCRNDFFGYDPVPGVTKRCELWAGTVDEPAPAEPTRSDPPPEPPAELGAPRDSVRLFISGHSLTAEPIGQYLVSIAQSLGSSAKYNEQLMNGSSIRYRARGGDTHSGWAGYSLGSNREGSNMNVVAELRAPQTLGGDRYDTLLVAERYDLLVAVDYEQSARYLRHVHERLIEGNPHANTYLYQPWFELDDKSDPSGWIAYERASLPVWECLATRANRSLAAEGRSDRIVSLPAGGAMAALIERATEGGLAGVSASNVLETVNRILYDNVHMTSLGKYYMALVIYGSVYRRAPIGAWRPSELSDTQASSLQRLAWEYVSSYYARALPPLSPGEGVRSLEQCQTLVQDSYCATYWSFHGEPERIARCRTKFSQQHDANPFYYNHATDAAYWLPAP